MIKEALEYLHKNGRKLEKASASGGTVTYIDYDGNVIRDNMAATHAPGPVRSRGFRQFHHLADLANFVENVGAGSSRGYFDGPNRNLTVVINDDEQDAPGWRDNHASFEFKPSVQFSQFRSSLGMFFHQEDFIDLIERITPVIVDPHPAIMLEVASSLMAVRNATIQNAVRLSDGNIQMKWIETTEGSAGVSGDLEIPAKMIVQVPVFQGTDPMPLELMFRWRPQRGSTPTMGLFLPTLPVIEQTVMSDVIDRFVADAPFPVVFGTSPDAASVL